MTVWACRLTGLGEAGIALVEVYGEEAREVVRRITPRRPSVKPKVVRIRDVDEVVVREIPVEESYTREPTVEIGCHGGREAVRALLGVLREAGVREVEPAERAARAVERGARDAIEAEAELWLPRAPTRLAARIVADQLDGALSRAASSARTEDDVRALLGTIPLGRALFDPPLVVIAGRPNAGKSTLFNALLDRERAIASKVAGTTRDPVEALASFRGVPIRLVDSAGLGEIGSEVDREAVVRTRKRIEGAALVICLVHGDPDVFEVVPPGKRLMVHNRADLGGVPEPAISALKRQGLEGLVGAALERLGIRIPPAGSPVVFTPRQARWIRELTGSDRKRALDGLLRGRPEPPGVESRSDGPLHAAGG